MHVDELRGGRVAIWGFAREGRAALRFLREHDPGMAITVLDDAASGDADAPLISGRASIAAAIGGFDVVVKSPGISLYDPLVAKARADGVRFTSLLNLWFADAPTCRTICVTGTKGKSTTSSVLGHLLTGLGHRTMVGGNIGAVPYDPGRGADYDYWVIEVSSYQATDLACSPPVTAVTSLHPDHLPWHGGVEQYYRDKLSACSQPGAELTVANGDSKLLRARAALLAPRVEWVLETDEPGATWLDPLGLPGRHNRRNALIARRVLHALGVEGADDDEALRAAAAGYEGLPSRLATIGSVAGVSFVDDSLSTNVLPTLAALDAFPDSRIALIVGGQDRGIDYVPLAAGVSGRESPTYVLTLPDSGQRISAAFAATGTSRDAFAGVADCQDLETAVAAAFAWARPDGIVLLSPAAPSFGQFRDYRDRAEAFARAMRACAAG